MDILKRNTQSKIKFPARVFLNVQQKGWMAEEGLSYGLIMYGIGDPVVFKNNVGYWYGICSSHM
jgi:hypothetical protein